MTALDWGIVAFTLVLALWGYRQGLIVGALTLAGFAGGALAGSRIAPLLLAEGARSPYAPLFAALGALTAGAIVALTLEALALNLRDRVIHSYGMETIDGAGGAVLIAAAALGLAWIFGAVALHAPGAGGLRQDVQRSEILNRLNDLLPPSGPVLNALRRVDPAPAIAGPSTPVGPPNAAIAQDPDILRASRSVVRVLGTACGLGIEGSGWVAAPGLVVTNAHVVAGQDDTTVTTWEGAKMDAIAVHYDPSNDLALLGVDITLPSLPLAPDSQRGTPGAILGFPENGPFALSPARMGDTHLALSEDSYGNGPIRRSIASVRGRVRSGNSGGPLVDPRGQVMGTLFASTTTPPPGGFAIPNEVVAEALPQATGPVDTGPCTG